MTLWDATRRLRPWNVVHRLGIRCLTAGDSLLLARFVLTYGAAVSTWLPMAQRGPLTIAGAWEFFDQQRQGSWRFAWPMLSLVGFEGAPRAWLVRGIAIERDDASPGAGQEATASLQPDPADGFAALDGPAWLEQLCGRGKPWALWFSSATFWPDWLEAELRRAAAGKKPPASPASPASPKFVAKG